jgi:hypothetical protein
MIGRCTGGRSRVMDSGELYETDGCYCGTTDRRRGRGLERQSPSILAQRRDTLASANDGYIAPLFMACFAIYRSGQRRLTLGARTNSVQQLPIMSFCLPGAAIQELRPTEDGPVHRNNRRSLPRAHQIQTWEQWQQEVVARLTSDFADTLQEILIDDVDWPSWHELYVQGRSARSAIERALERDL